MVRRLGAATITATHQPTQRIAVMSRRVFDILTSTAGAALVVTLLVAGGLLTWGHNYVTSNVHDQLAQQQITFPPNAAFQHAKAGTEITPSMIPSVSQYAGQELT